MATIQEAIYRELSTDAVIKSKLEHTAGKFHIYPLHVPEKFLTLDAEGSRMFLVYQKISNNFDTTLGMEKTSIQINVITDKYANALSLRDNVIDVLQCFKGNMGTVKIVEFVYIDSEAEMRNPDTDMFILPLTFRVKYFR